MRKQVFLLFAALIFCQAAFGFSAVAPSGQTLYYNIQSGSTSVEVVYPGYGWDSNKPTGNLVIPDNVTYSGTTYQVTSIGNYAFSRCSGLSSVTIPNSVTSIGIGAFYGCSGLSSVTIGNSVTSIGIGAFCGCSGLSSVTIPNSVTSIGIGAFYGCSGLSSVTIPNSVTSIGDSAFRECSGLSSVTIGNSVTSIGISAFGDCYGLTAVHYNGTIGQWCGITFGNTESNPLWYAHHLYINNAEVTSASIPNTVTVIKPYAFLGCRGLSSVTIPNSVTSIGKMAFENCYGLSSVTIPNSVTSIGSDAFRTCIGLTAVHYNGTIGQWCGITFSDSWSNPLGSAHHLYINNAEVTSASIPNTVTVIKPYAFLGCSGLTSVTIPNSVTSIGNHAFRGCSGLTSVTIPNSVTSIGNYAFSSCSGLSSVTIPNSVNSIGMAVFRNCSGLSSVTIPNSVTSIGLDAFENCSGLSSVTIPNSVTSIGDNAFSGCSGLSSMTFLGSTPPQQIGTSAFNSIPTDIPVYIPCGRLAYYVNQLPIFTNYIEQLYEFSAASADESRGTVQVLTEPSCSNPNAVLNAVPANGYRFDHWSTGSTANPYTLTVTSDTTVIGYFVADGTQGIDDVEESDIHISVFDGHINVEGVAEKEVLVYDITGRMVQNRTLPSGVYIVKIGTLAAQKVVVMR